MNKIQADCHDVNEKNDDESAKDPRATLVHGHIGGTWRDGCTLVTVICDGVQAAKDAFGDRSPFDGKKLMFHN
jgi:hypothetical protein